MAEWQRPPATPWLGEGRLHRLGTNAVIHFLLPHRSNNLQCYIPRAGSVTQGCANLEPATTL